MCDRYLVGWLLVLSIGANAQRDWDYWQADSVAHVYAGHTLHDLPGLAYKLTKPFESEIDKFRAIYTWTCLNIDNDYQLFLMNKYKREKYAGNVDKLKEWNAVISKVIFKQLLNNKRTICTGYAFLIRELATLAGLSCVMIDGYGRGSQAHIGKLGSPNHTWNAVQLNNNWYLCDATWSSGVIDGLTHIFQKQYDDGYFLAKPELFARTHYPIDTAWLLLKHKPTVDQFVNHPVFYKSIFHYQVDSINPDTLYLTAGKNEPICFELKPTLGFDIGLVELQVSTGNSDSRTQKPFTYESGYYQLEHTFKSKGTYTVHTLINHEYAFSYVVRVVE